ncbi:MAG: hypothetical protein O9297_07840 [Flavobacterium sp.]|uniref:hypothetical protein n=1 Tax=Flavobacterium sp. TaxID=239 RepID=UPI0022BDE66E|nr:hypothetical protein [Flavobacterium sp.]MCZ8170011.1 hypothetical protein [Flavobacterium sp.]MCZ8297114.1 hypothetical protein [Flavobacterium sp.]
MKYIYSILILFTVMNCKKSSFVNSNINLFEFDTVIHYSKNITGDSISYIYNKEKSDPKYKLYRKIFESEYPKKLSEKSIEKELVEFGYIANVLSQTQKKDINFLFSKYVNDEYIFQGCIPVYRDILIFKKNEEVIGIAKICFDCKMLYIVGSNKKYSNLVDFSEFKKLNDLLKKEN